MGNDETGNGTRFFRQSHTRIDGIFQRVGKDERELCFVYRKLFWQANLRIDADTLLLCL